MIDFHVHSNCSDGSYGPAEVIEQAKANGVTIMALTDHDTIYGIAEAKEAAKQHNISLMGGIELSVAYGHDRLIHILGLGIDVTSQSFLRRYNAYRDGQQQQVPYVVKALEKKGFQVDMDAVKAHATGGQLSRQALAKWLFHSGNASSVPRAWMDILDSIPYGDGELIAASDAFDMIHAGGGLSFLAHFHKPIGLHGYSEQEKQSRLAQLVEMGLDGLERYYPSYTQRHMNELDMYILKYGLLSSGGSDFHGKNRPDIQLGIGSGALNVPMSVYENMMVRMCKTDA